MDFSNPQSLGKYFTECFNIPKVELHAHLNGSIRKATLFGLLKQKNLECPSGLLGYGLDNCFKTFELIHKVCDNLKVIELITKEVLEDFSAQNCIYLEIRTTPKSFEHSNIEDYYNLIKKIIQGSKLPNNMEARIILSINRGGSIENAEFIKNLAIQKSMEDNSLFVGVDFAGNPFVGPFQNFQHIFQELKQRNIKTTIHLAEIDKMDDIESIINFHPSRVSHGHFINSEQLMKLIEMNVGFEICPSSKLNTLKASSFAETLNIVTLLLQKGNNFSINTDDTILFDTNISQELYEVGYNLKLPISELYKIEKNAIDTIFDYNIKDKLVQKYFNSI